MACPTDGSGSCVFSAFVWCALTQALLRPGSSNQFGKRQEVGSVTSSLSTSFGGLLNPVQGHLHLVGTHRLSKVRTASAFHPALADRTCSSIGKCVSLTSLRFCHMLTRPSAARDRAFGPLPLVFYRADSSNRPGSGNVRALPHPHRLIADSQQIFGRVKRQLFGSACPSRSLFKAARLTFCAGKRDLERRHRIREVRACLRVCASADAICTARLAVRRRRALESTLTHLQLQTDRSSTLLFRLSGILLMTAQPWKWQHHRSPSVFRQRAYSLSLLRRPPLAFYRATAYSTELLVASSTSSDLSYHFAHALTLVISEIGNGSGNVRRPSAAS